MTDAMDIDAGDPEGEHMMGDADSVVADITNASVDEDSEDEDDPANVAMVPMADMLNARYECDNVGRSITPFVIILM